MKKIILSIFAVCMLVLPVFTYAKENEKVDVKDYTTMNLLDTLKSESIEPTFKDYKETDDQVTVYLFRGTGCAYCKAFLTFLSKLPDDYIKKIKLVSFDAWYDEASSNLLGEISSFLGEEAGGVPYIIIGETVFPGYAEDYDEGIKATIDAEYAAAEKYDVFEAYNEYLDELAKQEMQEKLLPVLYNGIVTVICSVVVIFYVSYSNSRLLYILKGEQTYHNLESDKATELEEDNKTHTQVKKTVKNTKNNKNSNKKVK